jgi:hypothetical protein
MPKIQWAGLPLALRDHLFERLRERKITAEDLYRLKLWRESEPEAPDGLWYKDFGSTGEGEEALKRLAPRWAGAGSASPRGAAAVRCQGQFSPPTHRHNGGPVLTLPGGQWGQRIFGATVRVGAAETIAASATRSAASNMGSLFITRSFRVASRKCRAQISMNYAVCSLPR